MRRAKVLIPLSMLVVVALVLGAANATFWKRYAFHIHEPTERVAGVDEPPPPRVTADYAGLDTEALDTAAEYAHKHDSLALIVWRRGHIAYEKYWGGSEFNTVIDSEELSATLVALLVGVAQAERKIASVEESASTYLQEWRGSDREAIKIRDLLQMSSGLVSHSQRNLPWTRAVRDSLSPDVNAAYLKRESAHTPGSEWMPQSVDPQLLSLILERATGVRFSQYLSDQLWKRVGAADARLWLDRAGGSAHADCCLLARQGDWIRIGELLVSGGLYQAEEIVPRSWVAQMLTRARGNPNFGYLLQLGEPYDPQRSSAGEPYATRDVFFLAGLGKNRLWMVPSLGLVVLRTGRNRADAGDWDDARIPNLVIRGARDYKPAGATGSDVESLVPNH
jgi:CubicO group peptidase (beta-lactamase class C family)